jgi:hypothetical protein
MGDVLGPLTLPTWVRLSHFFLTVQKNKYLRITDI